MALLKCGSSYTHPLTPTIKISRQRLGKTEGKQQADRVTWAISGMLIGAQAALITAKGALETAYAADGKDITLYANDGVTVLHQLLNSGCLGGTKVLQRPSFPKNEGVEFVTMLSYEIVVAGDVFSADPLAANAFGDKTTAAVIDPQGQLRITVSGSFRGSGAQAAANAAKLAYFVESEQQTVDADTGAVQFSYAYIDTANSRAILSFAETVEIEESLANLVAQEVLGGGPPILQTTTLGVARATQSGQAVGRGAYPIVPGPIFSTSNMNAKKILHGPPRASAAGTITEYPVSWNYGFMFATTPNFGNPGLPPV